MAERPAILRGFRLADATALLVCALALAAAPASAASRTKVAAASDPSAAGGAVVYEKSGAGVLLRDGTESPLPGHDPALGGGVRRMAVGQPGDDRHRGDARAGGRCSTRRAPTRSRCRARGSSGASPSRGGGDLLVGRARQRALARRPRRGDQGRDPDRPAQPRRRHARLRDRGPPQLADRRGRPRPGQAAHAAPRALRRDGLQPVAARRAPALRPDLEPHAGAAPRPHARRPRARALQDRARPRAATAATRRASTRCATTTTPSTRRRRSAAPPAPRCGPRR